MKLDIKTRLSETDVQSAVYAFMDSHSNDLDNRMLPYITKKLLPQFVKMPEVKAVILEYALYAMQEDEDLAFDLILERIAETVEYDYSSSINNHMVMWFKDLRQERNDEYYEMTRGRAL